MTVIHLFQHWMPLTTTRLLLLLVLALHAAPALAQPVGTGETPPELADVETLRALLPDRIGAYAFDQISVPPGFAGEEGEEAIAPNVIYENEEGTALFFVVTQYRDPNRRQELRERLERDVVTGGATDTTVGGRPAYVVGDTQRLDAFVGSTVALSAYFSGGEGSPEDLYAALEAVDFEGLEALDRAYTRAYDLAAVQAFDSETAPAEAGVTMEALRPLLPERVGSYELVRFSASPFVDSDGWEDERGRTLTGRYEAESADAFTLALTHFEGDRDRADLLPIQWNATDTTLAGHSAFAEGDPQWVKVFVGETFAAVARPADGDVPVEDLYAALEATDFEGLEALDEAYTRAIQQAMEPDTAPTDAVTGIEGDVDCEAFDEDVKTAAQEMMGAAEFVPWVHFLAEEQAATAEREEDVLITFPKEGNAWLQCVRENDILWAPLGLNAFLLRVKKLWELPDRAVFRTEPAGFGDVMTQGRIEVEAGGGE